MQIKFKNRILILGFIASLFIVYKLAISKTLETQKIVSELKNEKNLLKDATSKISNLKIKEQELDLILKNYNVSVNNSFQQTLLQHVTTISKNNKLQIIAFNKPHVFNANGTTYSTFSFEIKGDFIAILKMINHLEQLQLGKLISIHFETKKNFKTNSNFLTCTILLQKIGN